MLCHCTPCWPGVHPELGSEYTALPSLLGHLLTWVPVGRILRAHPTVLSIPQGR